MRFKGVLVALALGASLLAVLHSPTPALAFPPLPSSFYGAVKVNGANVPDGTRVRVLIGGVIYSEKPTTTYKGDSVFSVDVPGDEADTADKVEGGRENDVVQFEVGGTLAAQTGVWHSATNIQLDLSTSTAGPLQTPAATLTPVPTQTPIPVNPAPAATVAPNTQPTTAPTNASATPAVAPRNTPASVAASATEPASTQPTTTQPADVQPVATQPDQATTQAATSAPDQAPANTAPATSPAPAATTEQGVTVSATPVDVAAASTAVAQGQGESKPAPKANAAQANAVQVQGQSTPVVQPTTNAPATPDAAGNAGTDVGLIAGVAAMLLTVVGVLWLALRKK